MPRYAIMETDGTTVVRIDDVPEGTQINTVNRAKRFALPLLEDKPPLPDGHLYVGPSYEVQADQVVAHYTTELIPIPTLSQRIDAVFPSTDAAKVIFESIFQLTNDVRVLKGQGAITRAQLKTAMQAFLNGA